MKLCPGAELSFFTIMVSINLLPLAEWPRLLDSNYNYYKYVIFRGKVLLLWFNSAAITQEVCKYHQKRLTV